MKYRHLGWFAILCAVWATHVAAQPEPSVAKPGNTAKPNNTTKPDNTTKPNTGTEDESAPGLSADECVAIALQPSAQIKEASAKVEQFRARLKSVEANYGWRLNATAWVAPMFTVTGNAIDGVQRNFEPSAWGPYAHLESVLVKPIYSFGRIEAGERAARARQDVEQARLEATKNVVALEVRRLVHAALYARGIQPSLEFGRKLIDQAFEEAEKLYAEASGEVTQVDLMKLKFGQLEVRRFQRMAEDGEALALSALKHTMGLSENRPLELAGEGLEMPEDSTSPTLARALLEAAGSRPEWTMLGRGKTAALSLAEAERLALWPVVFLAGTFNADWTPTRDDADNPYHFDPFNQVNGGVAVGLQWDLQPSKVQASVEAAEALQKEVEALRQFASTGIPLEVRKAHQALAQARELLQLSNQSVKATRKWLTFAAAAYGTGTGEARDILEGLVAYLGAKNTNYSQLRNYYDAEAELRYATGQH